MSFTYEKLPQDPVLRVWEVNSTHSRFEYNESIPSDEAMRIQFIILATINALVATTSFILILGILTNARLRTNPFNWCLIFISIPDFTMSFLCLLTCASSAPGREFISEWMCNFQSVYLVFGFCANCWMNALIVYEVHKLLRYSHYRRKYSPPQRTTVAKQALGLYLYAMLWGLLGIFPIEWLPFRTYSWYGFFCFPQEYDRPSTFFWWLAFLPGIMLIPIFYVAIVCYDIWRRNLLPPQGRRRNLAIYFVRLICVYFFMWTPTIIVSVVSNFVNAGSWVSWTGAAWSHLQGFVSAMLALTKPDIRDAVLNLLGLSSCRPTPKDEKKETSPSLSPGSMVGNRRASKRISLINSFQRLYQQPVSETEAVPEKSDRDMKSNDALDLGVERGNAADHENTEEFAESAFFRAMRFGLFFSSETSAFDSAGDDFLSGFEDMAGAATGQGDQQQIDHWTNEEPDQAEHFNPSTNDIDIAYTIDEEIGEDGTSPAKEDDIASTTEQAGDSSSQADNASRKSSGSRGSSIGTVNC